MLDACPGHASYSGDKPSTPEQRSFCPVPVILWLQRCSKRKLLICGDWKLPMLVWSGRW